MPKRKVVFGCIYAGVEGHYHPLTAKQRKERIRLMIKALKDAASSGELKKLMATGDIVEGLNKTGG